MIDIFTEFFNFQHIDWLPARISSIKLWNISLVAFAKTIFVYQRALFVLLLLTFYLDRLVPQQHCESISLANPAVAVSTSCHLPLGQGLVLADIVEATYSLDDELLVDILMLLAGG